MYPTYLQLIKALNNDEEDHSCIKEMKQKARENLEKRYQDLPLVALMSSILHPRTKQLKFLSAEQRSQVHEKVKTELSRLNVNDVTLEQVPNAQKKPRIETSDLDWLDDIVLPTSQDDPQVLASKADVEFMHNIAEPNTNEHPRVW